MEGKRVWTGIDGRQCGYLISPDEMYYNGYVGRIYQPEGVEESEPCENVCRDIVSKGKVACRGHCRVREGGDDDAE